MTAMKPHAKHKPDVARLVEARAPGLVDRIRAEIEAAERDFDGGARKGESYLWEHSTHVAALSHRLALGEKRAPLLPVLAALFHDSGKFAGGRYHDDDRPEEDDSAAIAEKLMTAADFSERETAAVGTALRALYDEAARTTWISDIVHDADFLAKFGALGAAQFFVKSTLRGRTLRQAMIHSLSKELTYAAGLPANMRTAAGRRLARRKSRDSLAFFGSLLREMAEAGSADLVVRKASVLPSTGGKTPVELRLAVPRACPACGGKGAVTFATAPGLKCEKLEALWACRRCGENATAAFCLPEIEPRKR
jgi:HD superfamily phosphodiesterase